MKSNHPEETLPVHDCLPEAKQSPQVTIQKRQKINTIVIGIISEAASAIGTNFRLEQSITDSFGPIGYRDDLQKSDAKIIHGNKENIGLGSKETVLYSLCLLDLFHHFQRHIIAVAVQDCLHPASSKRKFQT